MTAVLLAVFAGAAALGLASAQAPPALRAGDLAAAGLGVGLLVVDVAVPVPSSAVMIAHGSAFGVALGAALSTLGGLGAALVGFGVGRCAGGARREGGDRASGLLDRWGAVAIVVTRPVPVLAETTAVVAGASPMRWWTLALASVAGTVPGAVLYAAVGAGLRLQPELLVVPAVALAAVLVHRAGRRG